MLRTSRYIVKLEKFSKQNVVEFSQLPPGPDGIFVLSMKLLLVTRMDHVIQPSLSLNGWPNVWKSTKGPAVVQLKTVLLLKTITLRKTLVRPSINRKQTLHLEASGKNTRD